MEVDVLLAEPLYFKEVIEHADDEIGSLTDVDGFVNKVINLTWDSLTAHSIDGTLSWGGGGRLGRIPAGPCQKNSACQWQPSMVVTLLQAVAD